MEQSSMVFQKDGKNYLQLDCENAKELSMKLGVNFVRLFYSSLKTVMHLVNCA